MSAETHGAHHRDGSYIVARFRAVCKLADALMASELDRRAHRLKSAGRITVEGLALRNVAEAASRYRFWATGDRTLYPESEVADLFAELGDAIGEWEARCAMSEFLSFDARGEMYLTMPDADKVRARETGPEAFTVEFGQLPAAVDLAWMLTVQATLTRALVEAGYGHEVATPETLMRAGGAV